MRRRAAEPVEVYFLTDPLCPWSWAMEPSLSTLRRTPDVQFRSVVTGWLPSLAVKPIDAAKAEWTNAVKTGARIDATYWDHVAPGTSLIACAAVKAAEFQGVAKGEAYLLGVRSAVFERAQDPTSTDVLLTIAAQIHLKKDLFRDDLGVGRYTKEQVMDAVEPGHALSESIGWFGRRKMLRAWTALAEDVANVERQGLSSPALHVIHGKKESILRGFVTGRQIQDALKTVH